MNLTQPSAKSAKEFECQWIIFLEPEIISCLKSIQKRRLLLRGELGTVEPNNELFSLPQ